MVITEGRRWKGRHGWLVEIVVDACCAAVPGTTTVGGFSGPPTVAGTSPVSASIASGSE